MVQAWPNYGRPAVHDIALRVRVVEDNIVVTLPGYSYAVTYYKPGGSPGPLMKYSVTENDVRLQMIGAEFLVEAWKLANNKARELGWIV
jgi:hypothetical protein